MAKFPVLLCESSCVRDVRTIDAERIDVTVDSMKRYYGNVLRSAMYATRNQVSEKPRPRDTSYVTSRLVLLLVYSSLLSHTRAVIHPALARARPRGLFREITETEDTSPARKCAGNGKRNNPALPRGWICLWDFHASIALFTCSPPRMCDYLRSP